MLSRKISRATKDSINKVTHLSVRTLPSVSNVVRNNEVERQDKVTESTRRALRQWRQPFHELNRKPFIPIDPEIPFFKFFHADIELTPAGIEKAWKKGIKKRMLELQKFVQLRYDVLGPDLAAAHFLIFEEGKIKFKGRDQWISLKEVRNKEYMLPDKFDPRYVLLEIDASDCRLFYEGLENFKDLPRIKRASFARCKGFNDWYADRVSNLFPNLQFLDLSGNPDLTERGLEAMYRISRLKSLIVTNYRNTAAFELSCMMLEDCVPGLKITILKPDELTLEAMKDKDDTVKEVMVEAVK